MIMSVSDAIAVPRPQTASQGSTTPSSAGQLCHNDTPAGGARIRRACLLSAIIIILNSVAFASAFDGQQPQVTPGSHISAAAAAAAAAAARGESPRAAEGVPRVPPPQVDVLSSQVDASEGATASGLQAGQQLSDQKVCTFCDMRGNHSRACIQHACDKAIDGGEHSLGRPALCLGSTSHDWGTMAWNGDRG